MGLCEENKEVSEAPLLSQADPRLNALFSLCAIEAVPMGKSLSKLSANISLRFQAHVTSMQYADRVEITEALLQQTRQQSHVAAAVLKSPVSQRKASSLPLVSEQLILCCTNGPGCIGLWGLL